MAPTAHPTFLARAPRPNFVVVLTFDGLQRGLAGPFSDEDDACRWAVDLIGDDPGWTWSVEPVTAPAALPLAVERTAAKLARRAHLAVVH